MVDTFDSGLFRTRFGELTERIAPRFVRKDLEHRARIISAASNPVCRLTNCFGSRVGDELRMPQLSTRLRPL
jgi:hypothetical protein